MNWAAIGDFVYPAVILIGAALAWWRSKRHRSESDDDRLERIELLLAGRPADPETHMPGQVGFVEKVENFMEQQTRFRRRVTDELTLNGGNSLKDQVTKLTRTAEDVREIVDANTSRLERLEHPK